MLLPPQSLLLLLSLWANSVTFWQNSLGYVYVYTRANTFAHSYTHVCTYMPRWLPIGWSHMHKHTYVYIHICINMYMYTYTYTHICLETKRHHSELAGVNHVLCACVCACARDHTHLWQHTPSHAHPFALSRSVFHTCMYTHIGSLALSPSLSYVCIYIYAHPSSLSRSLLSLSLTLSWAIGGYLDSGGAGALWWLCQFFTTTSGLTPLRRLVCVSVCVHINERTPPCVCVCVCKYVKTHKVLHEILQVSTVDLKCACACVRVWIHIERNPANFGSKLTVCVYVCIRITLRTLPWSSARAASSAILLEL